MRSQTSASWLLLTIGHPGWQSVVTSALMYEYEDVARRPGNAPSLSPQDITDILDLICQQSHRQLVWFSWRPLSPDPGDDAILEAAIAGGCDFVVSFQAGTCAWRGIRHRSPQTRRAAQTDRRKQMKAIELNMPDDVYKKLESLASHDHQSVDATARIEASGRHGADFRGLPLRGSQMREMPANARLT